MKVHKLILNNEHYPSFEATSNSQGSSAVIVRTGHGYIELGPGNSSHCHIQTDISNFYFNKELRVDSGIVGSYDEDLQLRRANNSSHQLVVTTTAVTTPLNFDAAGYVEGANFKVNTIEVIDTNRVLKNITRADFANFTVTGTNTTQASYLRYGNIAANVEGSHMSHPYFFNDLANFTARGGTVTFGGLNTTPAMTKPFDASPDFAGWAANNYTGSTMTLTLTNLPKALSYGGYIGIAFGNTGWAPASCKIEVSTDGGSNWTTRLNDSSKKEIYFTTTGAGGTGINAIRFTLGQPTSSLRLTNIWAYNYNSAGMEEYFLSKGGGRVWGDVGIGSNVEAGSKLKLYNNGDTKMTIECNDSSSAYINFTGVSNEMSLGYDRANSRMAFTNHDTLGSNIRMILKSGGDWIVSNTDARVATQFSDQAGIGWYETGQHMQVATTNASYPAIEVGLNHGTSNASFINFRKQGTLRGSIGIEGNDSLLIQSTGSTGAGLRFHPSSGVISPIRNGSLSNETISLGTLTQSFNTAFVKKGYFHGGKDPQSGTWGGDPFVTVGGFESTGNHDHSSNQMQGFSLGVVSIGNNGGNSATMRKNQVWTTGGVSNEAYNSSARWDLGRWEDNSTNSRTRLDLYLADQSHGWYLTSSWKVDDGSPRLGIGTVSPEDTLHVNGGSYATYFTGAAASDANRYRFYGNSSAYAIGMVSSNTFGGLGGWAMAFKFSDNAERGFVWRDAGHGLNGGAMAVTTQGKLTVAHSARIGYGETDTTTPGTYRLDVSGNANFAASSSDQTSSNDSTTVPSTSGSAVMRLNGGYTDGRYATEFVKVDRIGNLPLYIRESTGTANSFSNVARFGAHANTGDSTRANRFYVFGDMGAAGDATFTGDIQAGISSVNGNRFHVKVLGYDASFAYDVAMKTHYDSVYGRAGQIATTNAGLELNTEQSNGRIVIKPGTGMVGINNDTPQRKLTVTETSAGSYGDNSGILSLTVGSGANTDAKMAFGVDSNHQGWIHVVKPGTNVYPLVLNPSNSSNGRVGIGASPTSGYHLDVNGSALVRTTLLIQNRLTVSRSTSSTTEPTASFASGTGGQPYAFINTYDPYHGIIMRGLPAAATTYGVTTGNYMSFIEYGGDFRFYTKTPTAMTLDAQIVAGVFDGEGVKVNGTLVIDVNKRLLVSDGSASAPYMTFAADTNTGFYRPAADNIGFAIGGVARAFMSGTQFNMTGNGVFSGTLSSGAITSTGLLHLDRSTSTSGTTTGTTFLKIDNYVGADLNQQKSFIDFIFQDDNGNETPQVRIGAEVGQNGDANSQEKEGSGAFVVYTNNAESTSGDAGASLAEQFRVDYQGNLRLGGTATNSVNTISSVTNTSTSGGAGSGNKLRLEFMEPSYPNYGVRSIDFGVRGGGYAEMRPNGGGMYIYSPYNDNDQIHIGYGGIQLFNSHGGYTQTNDLVMRSVNGFAFQQNNGNNWFRISGSGTLEIGTSNMAILTQSRNLQNINSLSVSDGTNAAPSIYFGTDTNTGFFHSVGAGASDFFGASNGGNTTVLLGPSDTYFYKRVHAFNGGNATASNPNINSRQATDSNGSTRYHINFTKANGSTVLGRITSNNYATTYTETSDYRLKENVNYTWTATDRLKQLRPCQYNWISDPDDTTVDGFLAHEVANVAPQAVVGEKDAVDSEGNIDAQGLDNSKLVPLLVKTIQELEARIAALENA